MPDRVYLDWNATTPLRLEARQAMAAAWDIEGNPSSVHAEGRQLTESEANIARARFVRGILAAGGAGGENGLGRDLFHRTGRQRRRAASKRPCADDRNVMA